VLGYQYVVLRAVPRVDRDEFVNVGVLLHSQDAQFLDSAFARRIPERLGVFAPGRTCRRSRRRWRPWERFVAARSAPGRPCLDELGQRFGWLAAPRSTVVQPGPIHGGLTRDPPAELERLLSCLVG
jgi:hypothetical protein